VTCLEKEQRNYKELNAEIRRSIPKRVYLSSRQNFQLSPPIKIEQFSSGIPLHPILTVLTTF
jgi:hypothetical protein